jgi:hypothetical protein
MAQCSCTGPCECVMLKDSPLFDKPEKWLFSVRERSCLAAGDSTTGEPIAKGITLVGNNRLSSIRWAISLH